MRSTDQGVAGETRWKSQNMAFSSSATNTITLWVKWHISKSDDFIRSLHRMRSYSYCTFGFQLSRISLLLEHHNSKDTTATLHWQLVIIIM